MELGGNKYELCYRFASSRGKFDSTWVIIERLTKLANFLPYKTTFSTKDYVGLYNRKIVRLYGVLVSLFHYFRERGTIYNTFIESFPEGPGDAGEP